VIGDYVEASQHTGLRGVTWGWEFVDELTLGQTPGDVSVIAARPGMGKSWTMAFLAVAAWQAGHSVLFVTMEMTVLQMARRIFGLLCGVNPTVMRRGMADQWTEPLFQNIVELAGAGAPFHFVSGDINKSVIDVENFALETAPDIVFIDAAYLLDPADKKGRYAKHEVLQEVLKGIKQIAMNRNIPVTISVQYNREAKKSGTGLENISGSDYIGQLASNVLSISEGQPPYQRTRRRYKMVKVRDGEGGHEFDTNFLINPPNFDFIDEVREPGEGPPSENMQNLDRNML
jgi:replicative DNA helicase